jgi:outer membrane biosynthesis protein TonB
VIVQRAPFRAGGSRQFMAFGMTVLVHVGIVIVLLAMNDRAARLKREQITYVTFDRVQPPPPPPPPPPPKPELKPAVPIPVPQIAEAPKPADKPRKPAPGPAAHPAPPADGPPVIIIGGGQGSGSAVASGLGTGGDGVARRAPSDYADKVKARILANKVFPVALQLKRLECVVTYSVTVDRSGHMIAHHIDPCPYPEINALAEAAILKSGPFDPPENGAETRMVYGSLPYHTEIQLPPVPARR